ncbi:LysE family translocator [Nocardiopsis flavescens]
MDPATVAAFWGVSVLFVMTPGADWAYAVAAGLHGRAVVPAVAGMLAGHLLAALVVAAGVGTLVAGSPSVLSALTLAGAAYLLWLGAGMVARPPVPSAAPDADGAPRAGWAVRGLGVSGLNPKVFLLFLALLPQFTDPGAPWPVPVQILALGAVHVLGCAVVYLVVGHASRAVLAARPRAARAVGRVSGGAMIAAAVLLAAERLAG